MSGAFRFILYCVLFSPEFLLKSLLIRASLSLLHESVRVNERSVAKESISTHWLIKYLNRSELEPGTDFHHVHIFRLLHYLEVSEINLPTYMAEAEYMIYECSALRVITRRAEGLREHLLEKLSVS